MHGKGGRRIEFRLCPATSKKKGIPQESSYQYLSRWEMDGITPNFCTASEMGQEVAKEYAHAAIGSFLDHKFLSYTKNSDAYNALPKMADRRDPLNFMLEVYVDNYLSLAIPQYKKDFDHLANATMHRIHSVSPAGDDDDKDPISVKKLK